MASSRLTTFLDKQKIKYTIQKHPTVYTAQEIAAAQHVPGKQLAKCVVVKTEKGLHLAVLPAIYLVDLAKLKTLLRVKQLTLAREADIKQAFPDVEVGAMSAFGNLYNVPVIVEKSLADCAKLVCNAGTHTETIVLRYLDLEKLATPRVGSFGIHIAKARHTKKRTKPTPRRSASKRKHP